MEDGPLKLVTAKPQTETHNFQSKFVLINRTLLGQKKLTTFNVDVLNFTAIILSFNARFSASDIGIQIDREE